jgi:hypothetical protein
VVGINDYDKKPLSCCVNDATAVHAALLRMGFKAEHCKLATNCDFDAFTKAKRAFCASLEKDDIAVFYFAGHGVQAAVRRGRKFETSNWLLAKNVPDTDEDLPSRAINAHDLLGEMEDRRSDTSFSALILDCCRNSPLPPTRSTAAEGLGAMDPSGSIIAFSCAAGACAIETPGEKHGMYTKHLIKHIEEPGLEIGKLFTRVRNAVMEETRLSTTRQEPHVLSALNREDATLCPLPSRSEPRVPPPGLGRSRSWDAASVQRPAGSGVAQAIGEVVLAQLVQNPVQLVAAAAAAATTAASRDLDVLPAPFADFERADRVPTSGTARVLSWSGLGEQDAAYRRLPRDEQRVVAKLLQFPISPPRALVGLYIDQDVGPFDEAKLRKTLAAEISKEPALDISREQIKIVRKPNAGATASKYEAMVKAGKAFVRVFVDNENNELVRPREIVPRWFGCSHSPDHLESRVCGSRTAPAPLASRRLSLATAQARAQARPLSSSSRTLCA